MEKVGGHSIVVNDDNCFLSYSICLATICQPVGIIVLFSLHVYGTFRHMVGSTSFFRINRSEIPT